MPRGGLSLVEPASAYLPAYRAALETGWSANTTRDTSGLELRKIALDPERFLADFVWKPGQEIDLGGGKFVERLPGVTRWIWDGAFCGSINFRHVQGAEDLPEHVSGHIGYSVVPWKRRQGCASFALRAILPIAADRGLSRVMVTCDPDNVGSRRVIESCGGEPVEPLDPTAEKYRFWIKTGAYP
ncbi:MAG: GNAT family N-acetyltransferase [Elsteraceae bacterium]